MAPTDGRGVRQGERGGACSSEFACMAETVASASQKSKDDTSLFQVGDRVRIARRFPVGHYRTPFYVRGKSGSVERVLAKFVNPEEEGYGKNAGGEVRLYRVRFRQQHLWPNYQGSEQDELQIEIFEHWLERERQEA